MTSLSNLTNYTVHLIFTHSSGNYGLLLVSYTRRLITTLLDLLSFVWEDLDGGVLLDKKQYLSEGG